MLAGLLSSIPPQAAKWSICDYEINRLEIRRDSSPPKTGGSE